MRVGTLFSGMGAPEAALKVLGIPHTVEFACDNDRYAKTAYLANHACGKFYDNVYDIDGTKTPPVDLLVFGFPCQPYSLAGKGNGLCDERGKVVLKALDIVEKSRPKTIIAENVEGLVFRHKATLVRLVRTIRRMGYYVKYSVLNSLDFGLPQNRRRLWIVGKDTPDFEFPVGTASYPPLASVLDRNADSSLFVTKSFLAKPKVQARLAHFTHDYIPCVTQTICRNGSSAEYISYVAAVNHAIGQLRKPSVTECLRLFGFTDFEFPESISRTRRYAMLANSMTVPVVAALLKEISL